MKTPITLLLLCAAIACRADDATVQIGLGPLLNARIVTTLTDGRLITWRDALDGVTSGEATRAAALRMGEAFAAALPDDGIFPATERHPRVVIPVSNADGASNQVRRSVGADSYTFEVPRAKYRQLWLAVMSGNGESTLELTLTYADGSHSTQGVVVPDWYFPVKDGDARWVNLALDLGKWSSANRMMEKDHHYLHGFDLGPDAGRELVSVAVAKTAKAALTLWGVTGVKAGP